MRIDLNLFLSTEVQEAIARDPQIARELSIEMTVEVDAASPICDRILDATRSTSGIWVRPRCSFTTSEQAVARWFLLITRKVVHVRGRREQDLNFQRMLESPWLPTGGGHRVRRFTGIALSRIRLHPNHVAQFEEWTQECALQADRPSGTVRRSVALRGEAIASLRISAHLVDPCGNRGTACRCRS